MKIQTEQILTLTTSMAEFEAYEELEQMLIKLQNAFPENVMLEAIDTGEIVHIHEIARVRGILSALVEHRGWKIK